jgi:hypothetical protein
MVTLIGSNVVNTLVSGTIDILYNSASFVKNGTESNKVIETIKNDMAVLDIPIKLQLIQTLTEKAPNNEITHIIEQGLSDLIFKIKSVIEWIEYEISKHNSKWFAGYRSISIEDKMNELRNIVKILDGRISLLLNSIN